MVPIEGSDNLISLIWRVLSNSTLNSNYPENSPNVSHFSPFLCSWSPNQYISVFVIIELYNLKIGS